MSTERRVILTGIIAGAIVGAVVPFLSNGASVRFFTDIEARIGYAVFAAFVFMMFGGAAGWAIGSLLVRMLERRRAHRSGG